MRRRAPGALFVLGSIMLGGVACSRSDSLVLLDLRSSGPLGAPVARVRLSASGWPTRVVTGSIGPEGFRVGYYGPGNGSAVSVAAEALDEGDCVLGSGSATVAKLTAGAISDPLTLFIRPLPANGCVPDAGMDAGDDAGSDDSGGDDGGGADTGDDGGTDGGDDTAADAGTDVGADSAADAMDDAMGDAADDAADDAGDAGGTADASVD